MKHLITCLALGIACAGGAQGTTIHEYPWNPDWNNDNYVGSSDLTGFLAAYGSEFGNPPEPCDYDGTPLENWAISIFEGEVILDSMYVEYQVSFVTESYQIGCPEVVIDTVTLANNGVISNVAVNLAANTPNWSCWGLDAYSNPMHFECDFSYDGGYYSFQFISNLLHNLGFCDGSFDCGGYSIYSGSSTLPFPDSWAMDENGLHFPWYSNWTSAIDYISILPYWHYAE